MPEEGQRNPLQPRQSHHRHRHLRAARLAGYHASELRPDLGHLHRNLAAWGQLAVVPGLLVGPSVELAGSGC